MKAAKQDKKPKVVDLRGKIKNFDSLKTEYELIEENLTLNGILRKMMETMEFYLKTIQQILQPEEFHSLYECNNFDDKEKGELFDLYKRVIIAHREALKAEIQNNERNLISTIQFIHEEIQSVKPEILVIVKKLQESWKKDTKGTTARYFG